MEWIETVNRLPDTNGTDESFELIGFNPKWICEDWNPNGTRVCFMDDLGWQCARWNPSMDCWITDHQEETENAVPTHWMKMPKNPFN